MCGIFGIRGHQGLGIENSQQVRKSLEHRGPDDFGQYKDDWVDFLHARLAIIGLGPQGRGPMISSDGRYVLTYNGEIYNYLEIKQQLISLGLHFESASDTEVLLVGFSVFGKKIFEMLEGIFAFGLWDKQDKILYLATDPFGIKPLYYGTKGMGQWVFSSEIGPILSSGFFANLELNKNSLESFLATGCVQGTKTLYRQINILEAGHYLEIQESGIYKKECYKQFTHATNPKTGNEINIKERLTKIVSKQLISHVPVGLFLSGGIDSTVLALIMRQFGDVDAFTLGVDVQLHKKSWDETDGASFVAKKLSLKHHQYYLTQSDFDNSWEQFIQALDHPSIDGFNTYWISKLAKTHVKVALSGLGADEIFAGYPVFQHAIKAQKQYIPGLNLLPFGVLSRLKMQKFSFNSKNILESYRKYRLINQKKNGHFDWIQEDQDEKWPLLSRLSILEKNHYLFSMLLRDVDTLSMRHGVEVRVPMLDWELWNDLLNMDDKFKVEVGINKPLLINAFQDSFKEFELDNHFLAIANGQKKGFELPIGNWAYGIMMDSIDEMRKFCRDLDVDLTHFERALTKYRGNKSNYRGLWSYFILMNLIKSMQKKISGQID